MTQQKSKIVTPKKYVYHLTDKKNRGSIAKFGLLPMPFNKSVWKDSVKLYYPDAVFANNSEDFKEFFPIDEWAYVSKSFKNLEVWRINTEIANAIWYEDFRCHNSVYTTEKIPLEALNLFGINFDHITDPQGCLRWELSISEYLYEIDIKTGFALEKPKFIPYPQSEREIRDFADTQIGEVYFDMLEDVTRLKRTIKGKVKNCVKLIK